MRISYNKLWEMLIDKNHKRKDPQELICLGSASITKLEKGENVTEDILLKIFTGPDCMIGQ